MDETDSCLPGGQAPSHWYDTWDRQSCQSFSSTAKGLRNAPGENNCFLNSAVQVGFIVKIWKIPDKRTHCCNYPKFYKMSHVMTKPTKWHVCPAETQISLGIHPVWSVFTVRMKKVWVLSYPLSAQQRLWSDWADAQADLSLCWVHSHFVGFVMRWLKCGFYHRVMHPKDEAAKCWLD